MPSKKQAKVSAKSVPETDDFQIISRINSIIESRLHQAGILTFADLASLTPEQIFRKAGRLTGFTLKQIIDQDWIGQARKLSEKKDTANGSKESEGFILNLFLDKQKLVHSTQILHVNSDEGDKWEGWDSKQLLEFICCHAGIALPTAEPAQVKSHALQPGLEKQAMPEEQPALLTKPAEAIAEPSSVARGMRPLPQPEIVFRAFEMIASTTKSPSKFLRCGEPFDVRLSIDAQNIRQQVESSVDYTAAIYAKGLDAPKRISLGEAQGVLANIEEAILIKIPRQDLAPGTYRLEAALTICKDSQMIGNPVQTRTIFQVV